MPFCTNGHGAIAGHALNVIAPTSSTSGSSGAVLMVSKMLYFTPTFSTQPSKLVSSQRASPYAASGDAKQVLYQMSMPSAPPYTSKHGLRADGWATFL